MKKLAKPVSCFFFLNKIDSFRRLVEPRTGFRGCFDVHLNKRFVGNFPLVRRWGLLFCGSNDNNNTARRNKFKET